jgi:hypothetical protein
MRSMKESASERVSEIKEQKQAVDTIVLLLRKCEETGQ